VEVALELALELTVLLGVCLVISAVAIRLSVTLVSHLGIMDRPGGHKQHNASTPFVGGVGLIAVLASMSLLGDAFFGDFLLAPLPGLVLGALLIFLTGLADDIWHLGFKVRFLVQALVALLMVFVGGVELDSLGELFPGLMADLGWLAVPITVFATIGLINALNMIDGIDGLSGSVSLASLALAAVIAHDGGSDVYVFLIVALMGGIGGFLYFNLRYPGNQRARVFLGDNGSTLLGFLFAWIFIALSQGEQAAMTPVTALWLFALPLMDTVGVMLRRLWLGKSPFRPDRYHLHHLFVRAGFRVCDVVAFAVVMQVAFALVGVAGLLLGVPEYLMFWLFLGVFAVYCLLILRPWRLVPWLRRVNRWLGMPSAQVRGIVVGYFGKERCPEVLAAILEGLGSGYDYQLSMYEMDSSSVDGRSVYCIVHVPTEGDEHLIGRIQRHAERLRRQLAGPHGLEVRLFVAREPGNDRRVGYAPVIAGNHRVADRRRTASTLIYSLERGQRTIQREGSEFELSAPPPCT
jgi:UDP-GlcNAc:undecaprenyl-phosphate GlcNAc-1-phosphate transferase